jgi:hypothetical protein
MEGSSSKIRGMLANISMAVIIGFVGSSCKNRPIKYPDPYLDALRSNKVAEIHKFDRNDTATSAISLFDGNENVLIKFAFGRLVEQRQFDSLNFLTRLLMRNDIPVNYVYRYHPASDGVLVQECLEYENVKWELDGAELPEAKGGAVFRIADDGRISEEVNDVTGERTTFQYNEIGKLLVKEQILTNDAQNSGRRWLYAYDDDELLSMSYVAGSDTIYTDFYSQLGLIDSTIDFHNMDTIFYRYIFQK